MLKSAFQVSKHPTAAPINPAIISFFFDAAVPIGLVQKENLIYAGCTDDLRLIDELGCQLEDWISPHKLDQFCTRLEKMQKHLMPKSAERVAKLAMFFRFCSSLEHGIKVVDSR